MKWTLVTPTFWPQVGGIQEYLAAVARATKGRLVVVTAASADGGAWWSEGPISESAIRRVPRIRGLRLLIIAVVSGASACRRGGGVMAGMADRSGAVALLIQTILGRPLVTFCWGQELLGHGMRDRFVASVVLRSADRVVAISDYTAQLASRFGAPRERISILEPPVRAIGPGDGGTADNLRRRHEIGSGPILLSVGRLEPRKNHALVLRALSLIAEDRPDVTYVVVGAGPEADRLAALSERLGIAENVRFTGLAPRSEVEKWYREAALFVMPARSNAEDAEGFGIVYVEAASAGTPTIGGRGGGTSSAISDRVTGELVDPDNEYALAERIMAILQDPRLARGYSEAGIEWSQRFSEERFAVRLETILTEAGTPPRQLRARLWRLVEAARSARVAGKG